MVKKAFKYIFIVLVVIVVVFLISIPLVNNNIARNTAEHLKTIPLPDNTEYIDSTYGAGKYIGNGNGMQYLGCILLKSKLSIDELREYFFPYALNEWDCLVEEQRGQNISFIEHGSMAFDSELEGGNYYILYSWGASDGFYSELDIRGH